VDRFFSLDRRAFAGAVEVRVHPGASSLAVSVEYQMGH
jgi:hypothetical protein